MNMMEIRRKVLMGSRKKERLPDEYREVEYIKKTTNLPYINTGILGNGELQLKCRLNINKINNGSPFFGSYGNNQRCYFIIQNNYAGYSYDVSLYSEYVLNKDIVYDIDTVFKQGRQSLTINDNLVLTSNEEAVLKTDKYIYLFGYNFDGRFDNNRSAYIKLYNATLYQNNEIVRNFIPCYRKSDGEIGMYDTVSRTFYTNAGTGTFLKGADVQN